MKITRLKKITRVQEFPMFYWDKPERVKRRKARKSAKKSRNRNH